MTHKKTCDSTSCLKKITIFAEYKDVAFDITGKKQKNNTRTY